MQVSPTTGDRPEHVATVKGLPREGLLPRTTNPRPVEVAFITLVVALIMVAVAGDRTLRHYENSQSQHHELQVDPDLDLASWPWNQCDRRAWLSASGT
jgi:hypothetical protein